MLMFHPPEEAEALMDSQAAPLQGPSRLGLISCMCVSNLLLREVY